MKASLRQNIGQNEFKQFSLAEHEMALIPERFHFDFKRFD